METLWTNKHFIKVSTVFICLLCLLAITAIFGSFHGNNHTSKDAQNTIVISGHGEVTAVPDIANISFTIDKTATTVKDAQDGVATIEAQALAVLKAKNIADADIQTSNASFNPTYEYKTDGPAICTAYGCPPVNGKNVITGYESTETINVKIRNTDDVGTIMAQLGTTGVSDLSGPDFSIDNPDTLQVQARQKAITDAQTKAAELAKELGVRLGAITSFSENGNTPMPMMYAKTDMMAPTMASAPAVVPQGENTITSDVTITYAIN